MDLFEKTKNLQLVHLAKQFDMYPYFRCLEGSHGNNVIFKGRQLVMMGSNNYLGLTHHPKVVEAALQAVQHWGTGCTGSRFLNGNLELHEELERKLAEFLGFESALVFATGFMANQGAIDAIVGKDDFIFSDEENHACIIEGCQLAAGQVKVFRHGDMEHLETLLQSVPYDAGKLIITDGVFSMTGHIAHYDRIHALAKKYNARTYVDDAHGLGVVGEGGKGTANHFGLDVDILMGTFSKTLASQGGFICSTAEVIEWIKHKSRTFMFSAALAPASAASALKALEMLIEYPDLVTRNQDNARYLKARFEELGLNTMNTQTCVIPVFIGDDQIAVAICQQLLEHNVFTTPICYPAVPKGQAVIRCSVMATHTKDDLDNAVKGFAAFKDMILEANRNPDSSSMIELLDVSVEEIEQKVNFEDLRRNVDGIKPASQAFSH